MQPCHVCHASEFSLFLEVWVQFGLLRMMRVIRIVRVIKIIRVTGTFSEIQSGWDCVHLPITSRSPLYTERIEVGAAIEAVGTVRK